MASCLTTLPWLHWYPWKPCPWQPTFHWEYWFCAPCLVCLHSVRPIPAGARPAAAGAQVPRLHGEAGHQRRVEVALVLGDRDPRAGQLELSFGPEKRRFHPHGIGGGVISTPGYLQVRFHFPVYGEGFSGWMTTMAACQEKVTLRWLGAPSHLVSFLAFSCLVVLKVSHCWQGV